MMPQAILETAGVAFPKGAAAYFDPATSTLIVINTQEGLDTIEAYTQSFIDGGRPINLFHTLHIFEAQASTVRELTEEAARHSDHHEAVQKLEDLTSKGQAREISILRVPTRSGQRLRAQSGEHRLTIKKFKPDDKGRIKGSTTSAIVGTSLEVETVMGGDGHTLDVMAVMNYDYAPPSEGLPNAAPSDKAFAIAAPQMEYHCAKLEFQATMHSGMARLMGVWKPEGSHEWDGKDVLHVAFLEITQLTVAP
jgi:hypothetical protein